MSTIFLLGSLQSLFLVFLLLAKKRRSISDWLLAVWLAHIGVHLLIYFLFERQLLQNAILINLNASLPLLQGPYLYMYVQSLTTPGFRLRSLYLVHVIPVLSFVAFIFLYSWGVGSGSVQNISVFKISKFFTIIILLSVPIYIALSFFGIVKHKKHIKEYLSSINGIDLSWLHYILIGMSALWAVVIVLNVGQFSGASNEGHGGSHLIFLLLTFFIYAIGYLGIKQKNIFNDQLLNQLESNPDDKQEKYKRSGLSAEASKQFAKKLSDWMESEKSYLEEDISLQSLSSQLNVSANNLSQVINQEFQVSFYDYINKYRVTEFISLRNDPTNDHLTLLALALDSGFSSKASFNRIFKKMTGKTPSQYHEV